jgi:cell wall-associated NlpC family hydrolase
VPATGPAVERKESRPSASTRPTLPAVSLDRRPAGRPLRRLGAGLFAGAAASPAITLAPTSAAAAEPAPASSSSRPAPSAAAQQAVDTAKFQVGKPYEYGAAGPDSYDCSGLTQDAYASAGISLPHSSRRQSERGTPVDRTDLIPGDLVFFHSPVSHVGIYIGDGQMVHAGTEETGVEITSVDMEGYNSARRIA